MAAFKLLYLALRNASKNSHIVQCWRAGMRQYKMIYPGRREVARLA